MAVSAGVHPGMQANRSTLTVGSFDAAGIIFVPLINSLLQFGEPLE